jgi:hypothetical protein
MANVYEGKPDERQSDQHIPVSRFRPRYRALNDDEKILHDKIKASAENLESLFHQVLEMKVLPAQNAVPAGSRYHSLALTALESSVMWIIKELTS